MSYWTLIKEIILILFLKILNILFNFIHDHLKADLLSKTQNKYFSLFENLFIYETMKVLKLVLKCFLRLYMQFGNTTKLSTKYLESIKKYLKILETLYKFKFVDFISTLKFLNLLTKILFIEQIKQIFDCLTELITNK
jgi:hypothetical protein